MNDSPSDPVRQVAEQLHMSCGGNDEPVDDAFCECWATACREVGPCGECYACTEEVVQPELTPTFADTPCAKCGGRIGWINCPTGGWWAHHEHPTDGHDAVPVAVRGTA